MAMAINVQEDVVVADRLEESATPHPPPTRERDSATMSSSTDHETVVVLEEEQSGKRFRSSSIEDRQTGRKQPPAEWEMRKTMRKPSANETPPVPRDAAGLTRPPGTNTHRSSPTYTHTSIYAMTQPQPQPHPPMMTTTTTTTATAPWQAHGDSQADPIARGAARTAFSHHHLMTPSMTARPVSAPYPGRHPHGARAGRAKAAAKPAAGTVPPGKGWAREQGKGATGQRQGKTNAREKVREGKGDQQQQEKEKKEKDPGNGQEKGKNGKGAQGVELELWGMRAMLVLARVVSGFWQVVSPVFDDESELRRRVEKGQARRGDWAVCVLAVVFFVMAVSAAAWAVRGVIWIVGLLRELGEVVRAVAGF
ncbi:hypothetical protein VTI74DRAFT_4167 [Chaetomium olivicolor]